jgi:hypothetical protein
MTKPLGTEVTARGPAADPRDWRHEAVEAVEAAAALLEANLPADKFGRARAAVARRALDTARAALFAVKDGAPA